MRADGTLIGRTVQRRRSAKQTTHDASRNDIVHLLFRHLNSQTIDCEGRCRNETTPFGFKPTAPIRRFQIAHVCDRHGNPAEVWRRRKAPAHHRQFALAIAGGSDNRRHRVGVDGRKAGKVARQVALDPKEAPHGLLGASDAVQIAHWEREAASGPCVNRGTAGAEVAAAAAREAVLDGLDWMPHTSR